MLQQELNGLREGFAQHGEAWLRERLREQSFPQLRGLAGAAKVQRASGRHKLSRADLEQALWQSIAEQEASEGMDVRDDDAEDDAAVSQQELNGLREGFAQHGEAWLRQQLQKQSVQQLRGLAGAAGVQQASGRRKLSRADLEPALSQSIAPREASGGMDVILILCLG